MSETHFDVVIIGSGFGGSVMAHRLAAEKLRVCLLERGRAYPPGSFPRSPLGMSKNFWAPKSGLYGMFDVWGFSTMDSIVSSGLGGGSLIYANVLIRKPEKWFVKEGSRDGTYEYWPVTRTDLDPHYDRVEQMLSAQRYPFAHAPYNATPKTIALRTAEAQLPRQLGTKWYLPNLAVTFYNNPDRPVPGELIREQYPNLHGKERNTCRLCGECDIGCNYGSKNTLDYNYLSKATLEGADIRTLCEVKTIAPRQTGGYTVNYVAHDSERRTAQAKTVTATRLVISAGAFGSTYLLFKNQNAFPHLSKTLGSRFSGNGDLVTFAFKCTNTSRGLPVPRVIDASHGPVITSTIQVPDEVDGASGRGFYIQDFGYPEFVNWLVETTGVVNTATRFARFVKHRILSWLGIYPKTELGDDIAKLFGTELSCSSMPLMAMGRDVPDGRMFLRKPGKPDQYLDLEWKSLKSGNYFRRVTEVCRETAKAMGGRFEQNPMTRFLNRYVTAHPLGGCPMGRNINEGVVDAWGEVYNYPGLYVADGAVMPGPVGPNPGLTIAALADRFADGIIDPSLKRQP